MICAMAPGKGSCGGDSGGPLVVYDPDEGKWVLEGIVSFGSMICAPPNIPGVYARVSEMLPWIVKTIDEHSD